MYRITAKKDGFRRAGMAHSGTRVYPEGHFSDRELEALLREPMLIVERVGDEGGELGGDQTPGSHEPAQGGDNPAAASEWGSPDSPPGVKAEPLQTPTQAPPKQKAAAKKTADKAGK